MELADSSAGSRPDTFPKLTLAPRLAEAGRYDDLFFLARWQRYLEDQANEWARGDTSRAWPSPVETLAWPCTPP